jgi:hypothetical protein
MNYHQKFRPIVLDSEPSIAIANAECLEKHREQSAQVRVTADALKKEARVARSMYQRDLLRQFMTFLASHLSFARAPRHRDIKNIQLQPSPSTGHPRGA